MATTPYNFVTPIRYYKANDPYYYEVDNIPLRQLEENILYVKDKLGTVTQSGDEISIYNIKELRPKVNGGRTIKVNAGRFVSRINDAYNMNKPLASLIRESPYPVLPDILPVLSQELWTQEKNDAVYDAFTGPLAAANAYNTNGLETFFTFYSTPSEGGFGSSWGVKPVGDRRPEWTTPGGNNPWYAGQNAAWQNLWPQLVGNWNKYLAGHPHLGSRIKYGIGSGAGVPALHILFVQMWRGIFRTAVVDVPDSTIEIPPFEDRDFRYYDQDPPRLLSQLGDGTIIAGATHRIDLLVAYSMPIDSSSTTIVDYISSTNPGGILPPTSTTKPMLGLVMGAGIGILKSTLRHPNHKPQAIGANDVGNQDALGHKKIVGNVSDQDPLANAGITDINGNKVHGSFPSPDDLLNVAPILALDIGGDSPQDLLDQLQLIGQAALPLAYIVVKKDQAIIAQEDIIDIRPFLRTTEFTYNERAGVAAANPPLSLANPAVGAYQLQHVVDALQGDTGTGKGQVRAGGVALYTDYIMGGLAYGVEGTMLTMCDGVQRMDDAFGTTTQSTTYKSQGNLKSYSFADFNSSKAFMEETDEGKKQAYLEWVYNSRQDLLKVWLSNPNGSYTINKGTYLGLPVGSVGRNIPLYPEWDMPVGRPQYPWMVGTKRRGAFLKQGGYSPDPSYWMWIERQSPYRQLMYAPGGVAYTVPTGVLGPKGTGGSTAFYNGNILDKQVGFGWGVWNSSRMQKQNTMGFGDIVANKKTMTVRFPDWVKSYDVIASYSNCSPIIGTQNATHDKASISYGMGLGLCVDSGMVGETQDHTAIITITSYSSGKPDAQWSGSDQRRGVDQVKLSKSVGTNAPQPVRSDNPAQWMMYSVCLPQYVQEKFGQKAQLVGNTTNHRHMPKIGGAMYPTVKFTLIGYDQDPLERNNTYTRSGVEGKTMNYAAEIGTANQLTDGMPPWQETTSIDLS